MKKHFQMEFDESLAVNEINGEDVTERKEHGRKNFKPMYLIRNYPEDLSKLEMAFDATAYQSQFPPDVPFDKHVFQSIFLNAERDKRLWPWPAGIDKDKTLRVDWWHQLCHSWTHYAFVVPWLWSIQGAFRRWVSRRQYRNEKSKKLR